MSSRPDTVIRKTDEFAGATRLEAQGLEWLAAAMPDGGAHVVPVTVGDGWIEEPRLSTGRVTPGAARALGRALAVTHAAGAPAFGAAPPGWDGRTRMGRSDIRLRPHAPEAPEDEPRPWGRFYAEDRIAPYIGPGRDAGSLTRREARLIERVCARLTDSDFDTPGGRAEGRQLLHELHRHGPPDPRPPALGRADLRQPREGPERQVRVRLRICN